MGFGWKLTTHARVRHQQRGIGEDAIAAALYFGDRYHAGDGSKAYFMSRRAIDRVHRQTGMDLTQYSDTAVILSSDDAVITVQYCDRPKKSWRGRH